MPWDTGNVQWGGSMYNRPMNYGQASTTYGPGGIGGNTANMQPNYPLGGTQPANPLNPTTGPENPYVQQQLQQRNTDFWNSPNGQAYAAQYGGRTSTGQLFAPGQGPPAQMQMVNGRPMQASDRPTPTAPAADVGQAYQQYQSRMQNTGGQALPIDQFISRLYGQAQQPQQATQAQPQQTAGQLLYNPQQAQQMPQNLFGTANSFGQAFGQQATPGQSQTPLQATPWDNMNQQQVAQLNNQSMAAQTGGRRRSMQPSDFPTLSAYYHYVNRGAAPTFRTGAY